MPRLQAQRFWLWFSLAIGLLQSSIVAAQAPQLFVTQARYPSGATVEVRYQNGPGNATDWLGIYKPGQTPGQVASTQYQYVAGPNGSALFTGLEDGQYFAGFFANDGYGEVATRVSFAIGAQVALSADAATYPAGASVTLQWSGGPGNATDWVGVYRAGDVPSVQGSTQWQYVGAAGSATFAGLEPGYYFASFFLNDGYSEASDRVRFSVGNVRSIVDLPAARIDAGAALTVNFSGGPGYPDDYLAVYARGATPGQSPRVAAKTLAGAAAGSVSFPGLPAGDYFVALYRDGTSEELSTRACFVVGPITDRGYCAAALPPSLTLKKTRYGECEPIELSWSSTPGQAQDWVAIYRSGQTPGGPSATQWAYLGAKQGTLSFEGLPRGNYFAVVLLHNSYLEGAPRAVFTVDRAREYGSWDRNGDGRFDRDDRGFFHGRLPGSCGTWIGPQP
ncbi:MAG: hypothetical protein QM778_35105 [Myxococcales bacterium]